ncbi:SPO11 Meiosis-specific protein SPO11 [Candida maltosa Xu316]
MEDSLIDYKFFSFDLQMDENRRKMISYSQLSTNKSNLQRMSALCKLIKILIKHLQNEDCLDSTTIRDIYYQDVEVFSHKQDECKFLLSQLVEDCLQWSLPTDLKIHPTQKGLVYGDWFDILKEPILIPLDFENCFGNHHKNGTLTVVILEKDAAYNYLCSYITNNLKHQFSNFLIVTAKGFSDALTLRFLVWLQKKFSCRFVGFFDSDVYGITIFKQYNQHLGCLKYTGVFLLESPPTTWLTISSRDITLMMNLSTTIDCDIAHRELTRGLFMLKKAEMNVASSKEELVYVDYIVIKILDVLIS